MTTQDPPSSPLTQMKSLGAQWWNDSCDINELSEAVEMGAVGATSNPVIVNTVVTQGRERWLPVLRQMIMDNPRATEDELAWSLIEHIGQKASAILMPVFESSDGKEGYLSLQVNPRFHPSTEKMVAHARQLASLAPNIAIKIPATAAGLEAVELLVSEGKRVNVTVSFTVTQAIASAEAIERGLTVAKAAGLDTDRMPQYVTIMEGRVDDSLKREKELRRIDCNDESLEWAGVAVFKKAAALLEERGYHSTLLAAAYRNRLHWSEIIGQNVLQSMPYAWWNQFNDSGYMPILKINEPVAPEILEDLMQFDRFRLAYDEDTMTVSDFIRYEAAIDTLNQFIEGYHELLKFVRDAMLENVL